MPKLRASEWLLLAFFGYCSLLALVRLPAPRAVASFSILVVVAVFLNVVARFENRSRPLAVFRDFLPIGLTLVAFREMELFHTGLYNEALERALLGGDRLLFEQTPFASAIGSLGRALPEYLELCYLLVYALPFVCIGMLYGTKQRAKINCFYLVYLSGTVLAYAFFPFLPLRPPRIVFPSAWPPPGSVMVLRRLNLFLLQNGSIHTAVLPSAHVSSAMSAAFAFLLFARRSWSWAIGFSLYAVSVAVATVYGRYHYAYDVLAGFAVSLVALGAGTLLRSRCNPEGAYGGQSING